MNTPLPPTGMHRHVGVGVSVAVADRERGLEQRRPVEVDDRQEPAAGRDEAAPSSAGHTDRTVSPLGSAITPSRRGASSSDVAAKIAPVSLTNTNRSPSMTPPIGRSSLATDARRSPSASKKPSSAERPTVWDVTTRSSATAIGTSGKNVASASPKRTTTVWKLRPSPIANAVPSASARIESASSIGSVCSASSPTSSWVPSLASISVTLPAVAGATTRVNEPLVATRLTVDPCSIGITIGSSPSMPTSAICVAPTSASRSPLAWTRVDSAGAADRGDLLAVLVDHAHRTVDAVDQGDRVPRRRPTVVVVTVAADRDRRGGHRERRHDDRRAGHHRPPDCVVRPEWFVARRPVARRGRRQRGRHRSRA